MKELIKTIFTFTVEYGIVSFNNDNHMPSPDFFEPSNMIIFPEPNMRPNSRNNDHYNINLRYFTIKSISAQDYDHNTQINVDFTNNMVNYIKTNYNHEFGKFEHKFKTQVFKIASDIPYLEAQTMLENNNDKYKKELVKKVYENTIDDISESRVDNVSIGRLLRLYNTPNRENAVYNTKRCGFSIIIRMLDESYLDKVLNIFNKVDYGFIKSQIMKEEYTKIEVFIYSKDKHNRELDIAKVRQFIKGYLKCYEDSFEIKRFDVVKEKNLGLYHKFNITGHDNEVFDLHGDNAGILYFRFTDKSNYDLSENVYEQADEFRRTPEYGNIPNPGNRVIITLSATIKNGISSTENTWNFTELNNIKLIENASFIPEKYKFITKLFKEYRLSMCYSEKILYNGDIQKGFNISPDFVNPEDKEHFSWICTALANLYSRLCFIDHFYKNQLFYGPYLENMTDLIKFEFANPIRTSKEEAPELTRIFFNVKLVPYVTKNIKLDENQQKGFEEVINSIMSKKFVPSLPVFRSYEGSNACDCRGE